MEEVLPLPNECNHCSKIVEENVKFCTNCGYPHGGTAGEKSKFHADRIMSNSKTKDAPRVIRKARNTLFVIAAFLFCVGLYMFFVNDDLESLIVSGIVALIYLGLGYWSQQKPLMALVLALLVYLTLIVLNGIVDPSTIYKGIIIKGVIIVFLAKGINSALHLRKSQ